MLRRWQLRAKINWGLEVLGRRADGYHELRSWFLAIGGGDRLALETGRPAGLELSGPHAAGAPSDDRNLVLRAEAAWREAGGVAPELRWALEKRLPAGSGLGAGSADAAAALQALETVAERSVGRQCCLELGAALGSDVPFFLGDAGAALRGGRGERVLAEEEPPALALVVAWPDFSVATAAVFRALAAAPAAPVEPAVPAAVEPLGSGLPAAPGRNDLQAPASACHPALGVFHEQLRAEGDFHMSGSGGAHYCACADPAAAAALVARLAEQGVAAIATAPRPSARAEEIAG